MDKNLLWPKEGKLKKLLIILGIVVVAATVAVIIEEQLNIKLKQRAFFPVALTCVAIWMNKPKNKQDKKI